MKKIFTTLFLAFATCAMLSAKTYYVSPTGSDSNSGDDITKPWATIGHAIGKVVAGDIVYLRGGTYSVQESEIQAQYVKSVSQWWCVVYHFNCSGEKGKPIAFLAYPDDTTRPVFDFSAIDPETLKYADGSAANGRITGFGVTGSYLIFKGFDITGVQCKNSGNNNQSEAIRVFMPSSASPVPQYNTFENLCLHHNEGIGYYQVDGGHNLILNCDSWYNGAVKTKSAVYGNCDGFGCHPQNDAVDSNGNIFIGCRAYYNNDDGFDFIHSHYAVTVKYCISGYSGYYLSTSNKYGDGNGIKGGGYGLSAADCWKGNNSDGSADGYPRHVIQNCIAAYNTQSGFYSNHHLGGDTFDHCTSVKNGTNFKMPNRKSYLAADNTDVDGYNHIVSNNISARPNANDVLNVNETKSTYTNNSWQTSITPGTSDFEDNTFNNLMTARKADGSLPDFSTYKVKSSSSLYGKGMGYDMSGYADAVAEARKVAGAGDVYVPTGDVAFVAFGANADQALSTSSSDATNTGTWSSTTEKYTFTLTGASTSEMVRNSNQSTEARKIAIGSSSYAPIIVNKSSGSGVYNITKSSNITKVTLYAKSNSTSANATLEVSGNTVTLPLIAETATSVDITSCSSIRVSSNTSVYVAFEITYNNTTAIQGITENKTSDPQQKAIKTFVNGKLAIRKADGSLYNIAGAKM